MELYGRPERKNQIAATVGIKRITHVDYPLFHKIDDQNGSVLWDRPEQISDEVFKASVNNFAHINNLFR